MDLYPNKILEHARHPKKFGRIVEPHLTVEEVNPLCGDRIRVELRLGETGQVEAVGFSGEMCAIARASASMLFGSLEGTLPAAITHVSDEEVLKNLGEPIKNTRVKCALLPLIALRSALQRRHRHPPSSASTGG